VACDSTKLGNHFAIPVVIDGAVVVATLLGKMDADSPGFAGIILIVLAFNCGMSGRVALPIPARRRLRP
jgi:hypothetical protein